MQSVLLILMIVSVFTGIALGIPVMFVLLGVPIIAGLAGTAIGVFDPTLFAAIPTRIFGIMDNQVLYAVPLFILMGKLLEHSGLAERALLSVTRAFDHSARSIAFSVIGISVVIACTSGIVGATITMLGAIVLPAMRSLELRERFSAGLIVASGSLGQIIPPSIVLILLSDQISSAHVATQLGKGNFSPDPVSVGHLFAGALLPGLCLAAAYVIYAGFTLNEKQLPAVNSPDPDEENDLDLVGLLTIFSLLLVPVSILLGLVTVNEASAAGVLIIGTITIWWGRRENMGAALSEAVELTGVIFGIILAASVFSLILRGFEGDALVESLFQQLPHGGYWALLCVMAIVFLLGFLIEFVEITYVVVPITAPILFALDIDPIWFAVLMAVNLQISFLTPPMGISLFYYKSVSSIETVELYRSVIPYVCIQLILIMLLFVFPPLATWLPSVLI
ncbi:MAG: TRAP transporter large permease [Rhizobiaceae bacterium]